MKIDCGRRSGRVVPPDSKSDLHRLLVAKFLGGDTSMLADAPEDSADIAATKRCLRALAEDCREPVLDCGESGSTLRFLGPVAAALGRRPRFVRRGRLAERPAIAYDTLKPGLFELPGNVSSQFATGLLFALPLLDGNSSIRFTSRPESLGYVEMTLGVLKESGVRVDGVEGGYDIPGGQRFTPPARSRAEADWSGAAFWLAMDRLGSTVDVQGLCPESRQPDRAIVGLLAQRGGAKDMSQCPDLFPALAAVAGAEDAETTFTSVARLRIKESDRVAAMAAMLAGLGAATVDRGDTFVVRGIGGRYRGGVPLRAFGDHRIAMAAAVAASHALAPVEIDDGDCVAKSYPAFWSEYARLSQACCAHGAGGAASGI